MEWYLSLLLLLGSVLFLMALGFPVAFAFLLSATGGAVLFWGGESAGLGLLSGSMFGSVSTFTLLPIPLYILLGDLLSESGMFGHMIVVFDSWIGRLPGRLALLTLALSTVFATMSGSSIGATAMLGPALMPDMKKRGYKNAMIIGPIIGGGGLDAIIPPSNLAVILGTIAEVSIGKLLIGGFIPGLLMATLYAIYIITRCSLQPSLAPPYDVVSPPLFKKIRDTARYALPLTSIIFLVLGLMFLGIATPSESAALGCIGTAILAALYRGLNWKVMKKVFKDSTSITIMTFMIIMGATVFSQVLTSSGATRGIVELMANLPLTPIFLVIVMQIILVVMGMFISSIAMIMITAPIFYPIIRALGLDPIWFSLVTLINMEMAQLTPPYGILLFVMKGVTPETPMSEIIKAAFPFIICTVVAMALLIVFPALALWLPNLMKG